MKVPFLDLKIQYESIKDEIDDALHRVMEKTAFAGGPFVEEFEENFASFCHTKHAIGVGSGTAALWLSLLALGVGKDDEVITVPNTFIATAEAISFTGAKPVFVDIDEKTYNMDPSLLELAITERTKAIIPVHLYGQMADMDPIMEIAALHDLYVIEDACQAHGAMYKGRMAGSIGHAGCFSFYPGKNLGAYGEAGAVVTSDELLADTIKQLRDHGQAKKYYHRMVGWNDRMDGFQGAVLNVKLKYIDAWNDMRRENAEHYREAFPESNGVILPEETEHTKHVYHIFPVRVHDRDRVLETLKEKEIYCGIHYPVPIHLQEAYRHLGLEKGKFQISEKVADELLSLPMFPELKQEQCTYISMQIQQVLSTMAAKV